MSCIIRSDALGTPASDDTDDVSVPAAFRELIGYHLRIAQEASFQAIRHGSGGTNIKPGWYTILTILDDSADLTPSALSACYGRDRSTLSRTLRKLAAQRLITRRRKPTDQRSSIVRLTAKGAKMLIRLRAHLKSHDGKLDALVGADMPMLLAALRRIVAGPGQQTGEKITP